MKDLHYAYVSEISVVQSIERILGISHEQNNPFLNGGTDLNREFPTESLNWMRITKKCSTS